MASSFTPQQIEEFLQEFFDVVGARQYVGARYIPIFGRAGEDTVEWDNRAPYEPLTVVMHEGISYVSRRYVPSGIYITDTAYWAETYRFNAQVEQYRQEVLSFQGQIDGIREDFVPFPDEDVRPKYGTLGQVLTTLADGETEWNDPVTVDADIAEPLINAWLEDHPEATTTVQDGSITTQKLANGAVTNEKIAAAATGGGVNLPSVGINAAFTVTSSAQTFNTIKLVQGVKYLIWVSSNTITSWINFYPEGTVTSPLRLPARFHGCATFTPAATNYLRLNVESVTEGQHIDFTVFALTHDNDFFLPADVASIPGINDIKIRTINLRDSLTYTNMLMPSPPSTAISLANLSDWQVEGTGEVLDSEPFRIRDRGGRLIYPTIHLYAGGGTTPTSGTAFFLFDKYGNFLTGRSYPDYAASETFPDSAYFAINRIYLSAHPGINPTVDTMEIEWLRGGVNQGETYVIDKNGSGDFTSSIACFNALQNDTNPKTIIILPGIYDVYTEMGGDAFIDAIPGGSNWRDVSTLLPPNTTLKGVGYVELNLDTTQYAGSRYTTLPSSIYELLAPLNVDGNCVVDNVTLKAVQARFACHDESSGSAAKKRTEHIYRNVRFINDTQRAAFGCGHSAMNTFVFENCYFECNAQGTLFIHDWGDFTSYDGSNVRLNDCVVYSTQTGTSPTPHGGGLVLQGSVTAQNIHDYYDLNNVFLGFVQHTGSDQVTQFEQLAVITANGCTEFTETFNANVTERIPAKAFNTTPSA